MLFESLASPRERLAQRFPLRRQILILLVSTILFFVLFGRFFIPHTQPELPSYRAGNPATPKEKTLQELRIPVKSLARKDKHNFRMLIPAAGPDIDLCHTLLTSSILGYPVPTLIAWNATADLVANTSHTSSLASDYAKITGLLEWFNGLPVSANDDLVLVVDPDDIWFQLRPETLIRRYRAINERANKDLKLSLGLAFEAEGLQQTVVFGASKRCAPNLPNSVACYPIPDSPVPNSIYGDNTDTVIGYNKYSSQRPRYLNAGYVMGSVADMRSLFSRAAAKAQAMAKRKGAAEYADMSDSAMLEAPFYDSYQHIFQEIWGEQEYQREVMRRRHLSISGKAKSLGTSHPTYIEGTLISDRLNPGFTHQAAESKPDKPDEFGIGVDYWSDLGQQTGNTEHDTRWLTYSQPVAEQASQRNRLDCKSVVTGNLPGDVISATLPHTAVSDASQYSPNRGWDEIALLTNLCFDTIPVMIHHTSGKKRRDDLWPQLWMQPYARRLMEEVLEQSSGSAPVESADGGPGNKGVNNGKGEAQRGGALTQSGTYLSWDKLCPAWMDAQLYRDTVADE